MIEIKNLSKAYKVYQKKINALKEFLHPLKRNYHKKFWALKDINLNVQKGEVLGIVGRNGSGKSTLLKVISGVLNPTEGEISSQGKIGAILELSAGFNPDMTGRENIDFYLSLIEHPVNKREETKNEIIEFAELGDFIDQPIKNYSSGMRSKFAFSVHTSIKPEILILDEVLSVGDDMFKRKSFVRMESLIESGRTVLFVTHNLKSVREICTRAVLLDQGEIIFDGQPEHVVSLYQMLSNCPDKNSYCELREKIKQVAISENIETLFDNSQNLISYQPDMVAKTVQEQKFYDVTLSSLKILNENNQQVNLLETDQVYKIQYLVSFQDDFENVCFRMNFKSSTSIPITAAESDPLQEITRIVKKGDQFQIEWTFRCSLLAGLYFGNLSILAYHDNSPQVLARYVDILAFKVQSNLVFHKDLIYMGQSVEIRKAA